MAYMHTQSEFRPETDRCYEDIDILESPNVGNPQPQTTPVLAHGNRAVPDSLTSGYSADFSSYEAQSPSDTSSNTVIQETLFEAVHGQLFEDYDPWELIKSRFSISCGEPQLKTASATFMELALANDRTGVGYNLSQSLAIDHMPTALVPEPAKQEIDNIPMTDTGCPRIDHAVLIPIEDAEPPGPSCPHSPAETFMSLSMSSNPGSAAISPSRRSPTLSLLAFACRTSSLDTVASIKTADPPTRRGGDQKTFIQGPSLFFDNEDDEIE